MLIGIDMGGTHIDGVLIKNKTIVKTYKKLVNNNDIFKTVWSCILYLVSGLDKNHISKINLSTTISTNAIVENKISKVGLITQSGPGINYDFSNIVGKNFEVSGYIDHRGNLVESVNNYELDRIKKELKEYKIKNLAIVSKFSTRNPEEEIKISKLVNDNKDNTLGHEMSGVLNYPRRVYTSYLNAAVRDNFLSFIDSIEKSLKKIGIKAPVYILKADGGTMDIDQAIKRPVESILSGPAASFMGTNALLKIDDNSLILDIGGTTTDIFFLINGSPVFEPLGIKISEYNTLVRSIYSKSIGLGGDSTICINDGKIVIGPYKKDRPVVFGGKYPTPTDAMVFLGLIENNNYNKAEGAMKDLAHNLDSDPFEVAKLVLKTMADTIKREVDLVINELNSKTVYTVREVLNKKSIRLDSINLIGGPAKILSPYIYEAFKIETKYPNNYEVSNAIGSALSMMTKELNLFADTEKGYLSIPEFKIYEKISKDFKLEDAKLKATDTLLKYFEQLGDSNIEVDILEASSYNMVEGFFTSGKNIRVKAQVKPRLIMNMWGENNEG